jgi:hypothetical protein
VLAGHATVSPFPLREHLHDTSNHTAPQPHRGFRPQPCRNRVNGEIFSTTIVEASRARGSPAEPPFPAYKRGRPLPRPPHLTTATSSPCLSTRELPPPSTTTTGPPPPVEPSPRAASTQGE